MRHLFCADSLVWSHLGNWHIHYKCWEVGLRYRLTNIRCDSSTSSASEWQAHTTAQILGMSVEVIRISSLKQPLISFVDSLRRVRGERGWFLSSHLRALRLIVRLGQPFSAFFTSSAMEKKEDRHIVAQVKDVTSVRSVSDDRTLKVCRISKN